MSIKSKSSARLFSRMSVRLWLIMMIQVLMIVGIMWVIQIFVMENNYIHTVVSEIEERVDPVMDELATTDLSEDDSLISYLSMSANGKTLLVDGNGQLIGMYSYGYAMNQDENETDFQVWKDIQSSEQYEAVLNYEPYTREIRKGLRMMAYEVGLPTVYEDNPAYLILHQDFYELNQVLDMNRNQLVLFSIMLTVLSAVLAAILSRYFTHPLQVIKKTVDRLAEGELTAKPDLRLHDEVGQLADSVEQLGRALQQVDKLRREVIANVSHELRSPLALIGGYAEMVRDVHWKNDTERENDLNLIIKESQRMSEMVSDILDYSQLQAGYLKLNKDFYNLFDILESEILMSEPGAEEYHIAIHFEADIKESMVYVDALKLSQVIRNLLNNAINHTKNNESIEVRMQEAGSDYRVEIANPGKPIPEKERELIWERYQRSQHQGGRNKGTGIGLSIVSAILKEHEIPYGVECKDGKIIFWFSCPKAEPDSLSKKT